MATLRQLYPGLATVSLEQFWQTINFGNLTFLLDELSDYYTKNLPLWRVLVHYGIDADDSDEQRQVPCLWRTHGGPDRKFSARYYPIDRNTGEWRPAVSCFKCQTMKTSLWYVYEVENWHRQRGIADAMSFIEYQFKVKVPRHIFLDFDPLAAASLSAAQQAETVKLFQHALAIRQQRYAFNDPEYRSQVFGLLLG